jgi:hypothetical protein
MQTNQIDWRTTMLKTTFRACLAIVPLAGLILGLANGCGRDKGDGPPPSKKSDGPGPVWSGPTTCYGGCDAKPAQK